MSVFKRSGFQDYYGSQDYTTGEELWDEDYGPGPEAPQVTPSIFKPPQNNIIDGYTYGTDDQAAEPEPEPDVPLLEMKGITGEDVDQFTSNVKAAYEFTWRQWTSIGQSEVREAPKIVRNQKLMDMVATNVIPADVAGAFTCLLYTSPSPRD